MLLTISTNHQPATELGYLLHKNPARHCRWRQQATAAYRVLCCVRRRRG
ncbi:hypothetical protein [Granulicella aggregans]|nr:hypothetical protein [Granulicella aggregans]